VLASNQPSTQDAANSGAGGARCRNSAPAAAKFASNGKPGIQMAAQGQPSGGSDTTAAAAPLQAAAPVGFSEAVASFAFTGAQQPAAAAPEAMQEVVSPAGDGAEMGLPLQGVLDSLVAELCPQLSDGDDTPMGYGADSDDFM
jgi:hypothetical protein